MVSVEKLSVVLHNQTILHAITCSLLPGRITAFIGKSGSGKTTLLKSLAGLIEPVSGTVDCDGKNLSLLSPHNRAQEIGYVFQDFNLFFNRTVMQNCVDPLIVRGSSFKDAYDYALKILDDFDMSHYAEKYPNTLSGGQKQRVAIARALCLNPKIILFDEPTASLDPLNAELLVDIIKKLVAQGSTVGLSSQDMNFVQKIFDRVYYMESGTLVEFCDGKEAIKESLYIQKFM